jgi:hypothetical protein
LSQAAAARDQTNRLQTISRLLEVDEFLDFLATEMIIANWDGYAFHQNNYRVYHNPATDRMSFIPHDLDNTFAESGMCLVPPRAGLLTAALLQTPQQREAFRKRVAVLLPKLLNPDTIRARVDVSLARLEQGSTSVEIEALRRQGLLLRKRIEERLSRLQDTLNGKHPPGPTFDSNGVARLSGWLPKTDWNNSSVKAVAEEDKACFAIEAANGYCFGSWRLPLWLEPGVYRLEACAKTRDVTGLPSMTGSGAGVRVIGGRRGSGIQGSCDWTPVRYEFSVQEDCESVELIAELRAFTGTAWFDSNCLRLVHVR